MKDNETITGYKVVRANSAEELEDKMKEVIENKYYQPFGGISISCGEGGSVMYAQAIVAKG